MSHLNPIHILIPCLRHILILSFHRHLCLLSALLLTGFFPLYVHLINENARISSCTYLNIHIIRCSPDVNTHMLKAKQSELLRWRHRRRMNTRTETTQRRFHVDPFSVSWKFRRQEFQLCNTSTKVLRVRAERWLPDLVFREMSARPTHTHTRKFLFGLKTGASCIFQGALITEFTRNWRRKLTSCLISNVTRCNLCHRRHKASSLT